MAIMSKTSFFCGLSTIVSTMMMMIVTTITPKYKFFSKKMGGVAVIESNYEMSHLVGQPDTL